MSLASPWLGSTVKLTWDVVPDTGNTVFANITLAIKDPAGTVTTFTSASLTQVSANSYRYDYTPALAGQYTYKWKSTGAIQLTTQDYFTVRPVDF
jgi:hypothetical protein